MAVQWDNLDPATYENAVAVLLATVYQDRVEHIDGQGGDDGRDLISTGGPNGLTIYELKFHSHRLTASQKRKIAHSLQRAAAHSPAAWRLVMPLDRTPGEKAWFDKLDSSQPFECRWLDRTWLDARMAENRQIERHYLASTAQETLTHLLELNRGQAALTGGAVDAADRLDIVADRLNEIDPQYTFELKPGRLDLANPPLDPTVILYQEVVGSAGRMYVCEVRPRYPGAERDRPLRLDVRVRVPAFSDDPSARETFNRYVEYGEVIEFPAESVEAVNGPDLPALGVGDLRPVLLRITPADTEPVGQAATLTIAYAGRQVSIAVRVASYSSGDRGGVSIRVTDDTGFLTLVFRFSETVPTSVELTVNPMATSNPTRLNPSVQFVDMIRRSATITLDLSGNRVAIPITKDVRLPSEEYVRLIHSVVRFQTLTGRYFDLPNEYTTEDLAVVERFVSLLEGRSYSDFTPLEFAQTYTAGDPRPWRGSAQRAQMVIVREVVFEALGQVISLGALEIRYGDVEVTELSETSVLFRAATLDSVQSFYRPNVNFAELRAVEGTTTLDPEQ